jgi:hypothetical protein|tara:strand:+ start:222 stop:1001 length:780 start_codon:yes stop_codon:yes gene_type:complete
MKSIGIIFILLASTFFSYSQRNFNYSNYTEENINSNSRVGVFLTYGQSNSGNHGKLGYLVRNNVYQFVLGNTFIYKDPSLGTTGPGGSVWGLVGDKLIDNGIYENVVFSNCGWSGKSINQLNREPLISYLISNYNALMETYGKVDGVLFHQGESDNRPLLEDKYYIEFVKLLMILKSNGIETPIYLSRVSMCAKNKANHVVTNSQNKLINDFKEIYEGPNTDILVDKKYRLNDYCHFSLEGYDIFSDMWIYYIMKEVVK